MKRMLLLYLGLSLAALFLIVSQAAADGMCGDNPSGLTGIAAGVWHTCVLKSNGNVHCYGYYDTDYLEGDAVGVAAGLDHTCVLTEGGDVLCYGSGSQAADYNGGDAVGVAAGYWHTCVLTSGKNVVCYGNNSSGEAAPNLHTGGDAVGVAAGASHTCVLTEGGNVLCYGSGSQAADYTGTDPYYATAVGVAAGAGHTCVLSEGGNVDCYGSNPTGQAAPYLHTGGDAVGVAAGGPHTCVLTEGGNVDCYGDNIYGEAADYTGTGLNAAVGVAAGWAHTCVLTEGGNVVCYGDDTFGQAEDYNGGDAVCSIEFIESIEVDIDIKPGSDPNSINLCSRGVVPVAILGSADLDVNNIFAQTLELAGSGVAARGNNKLMAHVEDVNSDGFDDLVVQVETENLALTAGDVEAVLTGELYDDGTPIEGTDSINIIRDDCPRL
jgi:alpha-tubulin suppressor-like RCC1 family protein